MAAHKLSQFPCKNCGKLFAVRPYDYENDRRMYCSRACYTATRRHVMYGNWLMGSESLRNSTASVGDCVAGLAMFEEGSGVFVAEFDSPVNERDY